MAIVMRGNHPLAYVPGQRHWYGEEVSSLPKEYEVFMNVIKSDKSFEDFIGSTGLGLPTIKPEGAPISFKSLSQGISNRIQNLTYSLAFQISMEAMKDQVDGLKILEKLTRRAAKSMVEGKEYAAVSLLDSGFDTAVTQNGGDGKPLFSATHVREDGGTFSNLITAADLSEAALESAIIQIRDIRDEAGFKMNIMADKLLIAPGDAFLAERITKSPLRVGTTDNDLNAIKSMGSIPGGVHVISRVADADAWYITTSENKNDGLIMLDRQAVELDAQPDFLTKTDRYSQIERYSVGWANRRAIVGSAGV